jgi:hypothetical protein
MVHDHHVINLFRPKTVHRNPNKMPKRHTKQNCNPVQTQTDAHTRTIQCSAELSVHASNRTETAFDRGA